MKIILSIMISIFCLQAFASSEKEQLYLIQIRNQLDSIKTLILAAEKAQNKNSRIKFHYLSYKNADGITKNGLFNDIEEIRKAINQEINNSQSQPRNIQPIKGDYTAIAVPKNLIGNKVYRNETQ